MAGISKCIVLIPGSFFNKNIFHDLYLLHNRTFHHIGRFCSCISILPRLIDGRWCKCYILNIRIRLPLQGLAGKEALVDVRLLDRIPPTPVIRYFKPDSIRLFKSIGRKRNHIDFFCCIICRSKPDLLFNRLKALLLHIIHDSLFGIFKISRVIDLLLTWRIYPV